MEAFLKKWWPILSLVLGSLAPLVSGPIQSWIVAHPEAGAAVMWIIAHLLPQPQKPASS